MEFYSICKLLEVIGLNVNFLLVNCGDDAFWLKQKEYHASVLVLYLLVRTWNIQAVDCFHGPFYLIWWLGFFSPHLFDQNPQNLHHIYLLFISLWACITVTFHHRVCDASTSIKPKKFWVRMHKEKQSWWEMTAVKCWCARRWYYKPLASASCFANLRVMQTES